MSNEELKIVGTEIQRPMPVPEAEAARGVQERLRLSVEVENPSNKPLHVWTSRRAYDYYNFNPCPHSYLTEHTPALPPGIKMISDHPRTPVQVVVDPGSRTRIDVPVPAIIRRRVSRERARHVIRRRADWTD